MLPWDISPGSFYILIFLMVIILSTHDYYMKRAIDLAKEGWGRTNPNPLVGAVIIKNDRIIAEGFHKKIGCAHAEVDAINNAAESVAGATLYVNLEPCSHYGRTPPCAKSIIEAGIKKVVVAMIDPNPKVSGCGVKMLKDAGIEVEVGILEHEARALNEIFISYVERRKPFVIMKSAMTLDGKIASRTGDSKWVTGDESRQYVHKIRDRVSAIMVGINTVLKDNPMLTTRLEGKEGKDPVRIILDSKGRIPLNCNVVSNSLASGTIIVSTSSIDSNKEELLLAKGVRIIKADGCGGVVDLNKLMEELIRLEIDSVLLEGGGTLNSSAIKASIVDKVMFFIAPKIIGGKEAITPVEGEGTDLMCDSVGVKDISVVKFGDDVMLEGYIDYK